MTDQGGKVARHVVAPEMELWGKLTYIGLDETVSESSENREREVTITLTLIGGARGTRADLQDMLGRWARVNVSISHET